jgi:hypothetical protein
VVRSQLSSHQLAVLFYNCLYGKGCEKIRLLIERHKFFKKNPNLLLDKDIHDDIYFLHAFGFLSSNEKSPPIEKDYTES